MKNKKTLEVSFRTSSSKGLTVYCPRGEAHLVDQLGNLLAGGLDAAARVDLGPLHDLRPNPHFRVDYGVPLRPAQHLHRLHHERLRRAVLREHGDHGVQHHRGALEVGASALYEHVLRVQGDLALVAIDDGRHGEDGALRVVDDGIDGAVPDDGQVGLQMTVSLPKKGEVDLLLLQSVES